MKGSKNSKRLVKLGDVFYYSSIHANNMGVFYQVIKVYESGRVRIRRIAAKELKWVGDYEKETIPDIDNFLAEDSIKVVKDNQKGAIREVFYNDDGVPYIDLCRVAFGNLYQGKPVVESYWDVWVR